ncbi:MAG: benzoate-CoA ligase family protein [Desulfobacteraceae bacterium]|nr:benzoate-CoA ligase family protein [Desulfobacteraceae bacterium]
MTETFNIACELLDHNITARPDKAAIFFGPEVVTYGELGQLVNRFGNLLGQYGVSPGDRVLIGLPDCPECIVAFLGSIKYGAWPVLASDLMPEQACRFLLEDSGASALITLSWTDAAKARTPSCRTITIDDEEFLDAMTAASVELNPFPARREDIAFMLYTSGSTGKPKGVPHRHGDILFTTDMFGNGVLGIREEDVCFSASKLFHAYGLANSLSFPLRAGASVVLHPGKSSAPEVLEVVSAYQPTVFFGVPTLYNTLLMTLDDKDAFEPVRLCVSSGEALPVPTYQRWKEVMGLEIVDGIGSTEALHVFISNRSGDVRPGTSGFPVPSYEVKIVDDSGAPAASGEPGHLLVRGGSTAPYYWNRPEETRETMLEDGWLRTGDIYIENEGCYRYWGRADDMFKADAQWVSPVIVEEVLRGHKAVAECAVTWRLIGGLQKPLAFVVLKPGFEESFLLFRDLRAHVLDRLPEHMCPVQMEYRSELPKNEAGKVDRVRLRTDLKSMPSARS